MYCPNCKNQIKVNRFCTRCGLNLMVSHYRNLQDQYLNRIGQCAAATSRLAEPNEFATQRLNIAQTAQLAVRATMPEQSAFGVPPVILQKKTVNRLVPLILTLAVILIVVGVIFSVRSSQPATVQAETMTLATSTANPANEGEPVMANSLWRVVETQTQNVSDAQLALLPDQQMAVIEPGGQLALALKDGRFFSNGSGADIQVHSVTEQTLRYRIFVRDAEDVIWQRIDFNRRPLPNGLAQHDMGHHGMEQARQVMIVNDGPEPLKIDAVSALYPRTVNELAR